MTPRQARAARAMLDLDMKSVCSLAGIGKRTLAEFENGTRLINSVTEGHLRGFYMSRGILFSDAAASDEGLKFFVKDTINNLDNVREKIESNDFFAATELLRRFDQTYDFLKSIPSELNISKSIIAYAMRHGHLNQKQISLLIGCTPSFINAIAVGRKSIPLSYSSKIQSLIPKEICNVHDVLQIEKLMKKIHSDITTKSGFYIKLLAKLE